MCHTALSGRPSYQVEAISHMAHANLIRLLGFCTDEGEEILVYEYAARGSLQDHLHPKPNAAFRHMPLTFERRLNIALGAAQGLTYLHNFAKPTTVHRDVKPANILLDADLNVSLLSTPSLYSDFTKMVWPSYFSPDKAMEVDEEVNDALVLSAGKIG